MHKAEACRKGLTRGRRCGNISKLSREGRRELKDHRKVSEKTFEKVLTKETKCDMIDRLSRKRTKLEKIITDVFEKSASKKSSKNFEKST